MSGLVSRGALRDSLEIVAFEALADSLTNPRRPRVTVIELLIDVLDPMDWEGDSHVFAVLHEPLLSWSVTHLVIWLPVSYMIPSIVESWSDGLHD